MKTLTHWLDVEEPENMIVFSSLLPLPQEQIGVYRDIRNKEALLAQLLQVEVSSRPTPNPHIKILKLYDVGIGIMDSVSREHLQTCISANIVDPTTKVTLSYRHLNIFTDLELQDFPLQAITTAHTYLGINTTTKRAYRARIGPFTPPNRLYLQDRFNARESTLEKTLQSPHFKSYSIVDSRLKCNGDMPQ